MYLVTTYTYYSSTCHDYMYMYYILQYNKHYGLEWILSCTIQISNHNNSEIPVYLDNYFNHKRIMTCLHIIFHTFV